MHLATNHPRPNAFGDKSPPAKCIWRQSTPYQVGLNRYDSAPLHSKFEDRNPLANKASCWSTNSPGNVVTIDFRSQSQQHTMSCKFKWLSSDNCELFWQGRHIYPSPPTHYGLPWFAYFFQNQILLDALTQLLGFGRCILSNLPDEILAGLGTDPK